MNTVEGLMVPKNNQTRGSSSYAMLHPGLLDRLDYPDIASLACPKPILFYAGEKDHLFPAESTREAFAKMESVWRSQGAGGRVQTRFWDAGHTFNAAMQDAAFAWLEEEL